MPKQTRGIETVICCKGVKYINDYPVMGGQGKNADLHPPMWREGT
jgi:hypothetical protein